MLVTLPARFATLLLVFDGLFATFDTFMFVAYSCEPFTASVLVALTITSRCTSQRTRACRTREVNHRYRRYPSPP